MHNEKVELLILTAKAVGLQFIEPAEGYSGDTGIHVGSNNVMRCCNWNPIDEDDDALWLAVKLHLWVGVHEDGTTVSDYYGRFEGVFEELHNTDSHAATRLAIVRAAAEIGKLIK